MPRLKRVTGKFGFNRRIRHKANGILIGRIISEPISKGGQVFYDVYWDGVPGRSRVAEDDLERTDKAAPGMTYRDNDRSPISRHGLELRRLDREMSGNPYSREHDDRKDKVK